MSPEKPRQKETRKEIACVVEEAPVWEKPVAKNTYRIRLRKPEGFTFVPGQAIKFPVLNNEGELLEKKSFSIASAPHEPFLELVFRVKQPFEKNSPTKKMLFDLKKGQSIKVLDVLREKLDAVVYPDDLPKGTPVVMLSGGVGVTPFISMLRHAKHIGDKRTFHLLHAHPTGEHIIPEYEEELQTYNSSLAPDGRIKGFTTREEKEGYQHGYFDKKYIRSVIGASGKMPAFFVSGPEQMVTETKALLESLQVPDSRIRLKIYKGYEGADDTHE